MKNIIVLISGRQGAGKSTLAGNLFKALLKDERCWVYNYKFADPLYEMYDKIWKVLETHGEPRPTKIDGTLLQLLGSDWARKTVRSSFWVDIMKRRVQSIIRQANLWPRNRIIIIDDARFPDEIEAFDRADFKVLKLRLEASEHVRKVRAAKWRENTTHMSETALDSYPGFDTIIYTDTHNEEDTLRLAAAKLDETIRFA